MRVLVIGAGQVGCALSAAFRKYGHSCRLYAYRAGLPKSFPAAELLLLCTRDGQLPAVVSALGRSRLPSQVIVAHVAGAIGPEVLLPLRGRCVGTAQMHPYASILSAGRPLSFEQMTFLVTGDSTAVRRIKGWLRGVGAAVITPKSVDRARYHLAAALLANGAVVLMHHAERLLEQSGIAARSRIRLVSALLASVQRNVETLGTLRALTGPVRRGDCVTLERHLTLLSTSKGAALPLYRALIAAQLEMTAGLGELTVLEQRRVRRLLKAR